MQAFLTSFTAQQSEVAATLHDVKKLQSRVDVDIAKKMRRISLTQNVVETLSSKMESERRHSFDVGESAKKWDLLRLKGGQLAQVMKARDMLEAKYDRDDGEDGEEGRGSGRRGQAAMDAVDGGEGDDAPIKRLGSYK
jgi:hypothetical protein